MKKSMEVRAAADAQQEGLLILPIKKQWFDMILSGEKKEEYREIKPYWTARLLKWLGFPKSVEEDVLELLRKMDTRNPREVLFRNGYSSDSSSFTAMCTLRIGTGKEEWGAEPGQQYFILTVHRIRAEDTTDWRQQLISRFERVR